MPSLRSPFTLSPSVRLDWRATLLLQLPTFVLVTLKLVADVGNWWIATFLLWGPVAAFALLFGLAVAEEQVAAWLAHEDTSPRF